MENQKYYNAQILLEMMDGNQDEIAELATMLIQLGPEMISEIEAAIGTEDWKKASDVAHKLKSSMKLWCMDNLASYCFFIEINGEKQTELDEIRSQFELLKEGFNLTMNQMKADFGVE